MAEIVKYYYPKLVQLHNYMSANGISQKKENWRTLNSKVLRHFDFEVIIIVIFCFLSHSLSLWNIGSSGGGGGDLPC